MFDAFFVTILFIVFFGVSNTLKDRGFSYTNTPARVSIFFLFGVVLLCCLFWRYFSFLPLEAPFIPAFLSLSGLFFCITVLFWAAHRFFDAPLDLIRRYGHTDGEFLQMSMTYVVPKSMEILFQQTTITLLILILSARIGLGYTMMSLWMLVLFGTVHLFLYFFQDIRFVILYTVGAFVGAIIFPFFVLQIPYGFVYNYIIHWFFYLVAGTAVWVWHAAIKRRASNE